MFKESPSNELNSVIITILLVPNFSLISLSSIIEPLRLANRNLKKNIYSWKIITKSGLPEKSSSGVQIKAQGSIEDVPNPDNIIVLSGINANLYKDETIFNYLRCCSRKGSYIGSACTGSYVLANAGLLDNYTCTLHWENIDSFNEQFTNINTKPELFIFDRDRFSCAGGESPVDMILEDVKLRFSEETVTYIADQLIHNEVRKPTDNHRIPLQTRVKTRNKKIIRAIEIMEKNIEMPIPRNNIAKEIELSPRQMERLFKKYLGISPAKYYLQVRLKYSNRLLQYTTLSITDISLATGFSSVSHFSKCYRDLFSHSPKQIQNIN